MTKIGDILKESFFSGDRNRPLWDWIDRRNGRTWSICYSAGCRLQEFEAWVRWGCRRRRVEFMVFEVE